MTTAESFHEEMQNLDLKVIDFRIVSKQEFYGTTADFFEYMLEYYCE